MNAALASDWRCPVCHAAPGASCRTDTGMVRTHVHTERAQAAHGRLGLLRRPAPDLKPPEALRGLALTARGPRGGCGEVPGAGRFYRGARSRAFSRLAGGGVDVSLPAGAWVGLRDALWASLTVPRPHSVARRPYLAPSAA